MLTIQSAILKGVLGVTLLIELGGVALVTGTPGPSITNAVTGPLNRIYTLRERSWRVDLSIEGIFRCPEIDE